jgi:uncharacterized LabA/DUF88 family protein
MKPKQIKEFFQKYEPKRQRTLVIIDFANVEKWKMSLGWRIGIQELAMLVKNFSKGQRYLRRFYYGSDYGKQEMSTVLDPWSKGVLTRAKMNGLEVITKKVKYIHSADSVHGFEKKCDLDVEMTIDMIREKDNYDTIVLFSGDGDLAYALTYLRQEFDKEVYVFGARDHIGREMLDAKQNGIITNIFFAEDFEYRISMDRVTRS